MEEVPSARTDAASERRFREMADDAPVMLWVTEPDARCSYLNRRWYEFTGQTPETALGFGWLDATHPDDRERAERLFVAANERGEPFRLEYRLRRHDGEYRWAIDAAAPRFSPAGDFLGYVGSVIDISDRKDAEDALRESEGRFRLLFTSIDEGYCLCEMILDGDGRAVDYRFLETNPLFEAMTGLADAVGRTAYELVPDLEPHWVETYARVALDGEPLRFENGSEAMGRWFDVYGTPVPPHGRFALVFKDITQRRRAEIALREREAAERRAREQAELLAQLGAELEAVEGFDARLRRLAELLVPRVADAAWVDLRAQTGSPGDSLLAVPLELGAGVRGTLFLGFRDPARRAAADDEPAFLAEIADRVGAVFARARLREEEHQVAVRLQQALLPGAVQSRPGVELAARYAAGSDLLEVGGDWYDTFTLPDGRLGITVGDVVGHGLEAAAAMGRLRIALAALAMHAGGPGRLLSLLDGFAAGPNGAEFATACCAILDPATGELRYASAGHPPMLVVTPAGEPAWLEDGRSPPFYGEVEADRPEASVVLEPGALLVLYSDGLVERRRESLTVALERLERAVAAAREMPVEALCDRLVADLGVRSARDDDVVVVCARLAAARFQRRFPARPEELGRLRAALRAWMDERSIAEPVRSHLLLAAGEACTNAVEHAYLGQDGGDVEVEVSEHDAELAVEVRDSGTWRARVSGGGVRGRGTGIIEAVTTSFARDTGPRGTTVSFRMPVR